MGDNDLVSGHATCVKDIRNAYKIVARNPEGQKFWVGGRGGEGVGKGWGNNSADLEEYKFRLKMI